MRLKAFGLIDLLIGLLIATFVFLISAKTLTSPLKFNSNNHKKESIQEYVDKQVSEIESLKKQKMKLEENFNQ